MLSQFVRTPSTPAEARTQVRDLKAAGADAIKAVLDAGQASFLYTRLDLSILRAIIEEAHAVHLTAIVHTGDSHDIADAVSAGADGIEHGSYRDQIPAELLALMAKKGITLNPTLAVVEAWTDFVAGKTDLLDRPMVQQVGPVDLLRSTKKLITQPAAVKLRERLDRFTLSLTLAMENLHRAYRAGVPLVAGTDSGNMLLVHGPALHRELRLWVQAGVPPEAALRAATFNAAKLLRADARLGSLTTGHDATLLLLDGNPLEDIAVTERISGLFLKGERVNRTSLFEDAGK